MSKKDDRAVHVVPENDLRPHIETGTDCWCKPRVEKHPGHDVVVVHNSMDGRELVERHGVN